MPAQISHHAPAEWGNSLDFNVNSIFGAHYHKNKIIVPLGMVSLCNRTTSNLFIKKGCLLKSAL